MPDADLPREPDPSGARYPEVVVVDPAGWPEAEGLVPWITALLLALAPGADSFAVRLADDDALHQMNRAFRGKDRPTDVLSFPGGVDVEGYHVGDVAVSVPTARRQAAGRGHTARREVRLLILHGLLHCLGYDHETDGGEMERLEARLRKEWLDDE